MRQLANAFYLLVFVAVSVILLMRTRGGKDSMGGVMSAFFAPAILVPVTLVVGWNGAVVCLLYRSGFWNTSMLWDTVMFVAIGGIGALFGANGKTYNLGFFARTILKNAGIIVALEFLTNWYTLGWWEFILVPIVALLGILLAVSDTDEKFAPLPKVLGGLMSLIGLALLGHAVTHVIANYETIFTVNAAKMLVLPLVLSVAFAPLLYLLCAFLAYDEAMRMLWWRGDEGAIAIVRWKKRRLVVRFGGNLAALQRFRKSRAYQEYKWASSKDEAKRVLRQPIPEVDEQDDLELE